MNGMTAIGRIAWKEYRQLRSVWIAFVAVAIVALLVSTMMLKENQQAQAAFWGYLLAAVCGAVLFASEKEHGTFRNLQFAPIDWRQVLVGKGLVGAIAVLLVPLVLYLIVAVVTPPPRAGAIGRPGFPQAVLVYGSGCAQFFVFGLFWSMLCQRVINAALLAIVAASVCDAALIAAARPLEPDYFGLQTYATIAGYRVLLAAIVLMVSVPLSRRWWLGTSTELRRGRKARAAVAGEVSGAVGSRSIVPRLLWQSLYGDYHGVLIVAGLVLVGAVASCFLTVSLAVPALLLISIVSCWLGGILCFATDQQSHSYRFFVQHREHPRLLWGSRVMFWAGVLALVNLLGLTVVLSFARSVDELPPLGLIAILQSPYMNAPEMILAQSSRLTGYVLSALIVVFCSGQLCSLLFRRTIVAGFVAALVSFAGLVWTAVAMLFALPWWWAVLPVALALLVAACWWAPRWMGEARPEIGWACCSVAVGVGALAVLAIGNEYRRGYVPPVEVAWPFEEEDPQPVLEEARQRFTIAYEQMVWDSGWRNNDPVYFHIESLVHELQVSGTLQSGSQESARRAIEVNAEAMALFDEALNYLDEHREQLDGLRPWSTGLVKLPRERTALPPFDLPVPGLIYRYLQLAAHLEIQDGDIKAAWQRLETGLRWQYYSEKFYAYGPNFQYRLLRQISEWADQPGVTGDQLVAASAALSRYANDPWDKLRRMVYESHWDRAGEIAQSSLPDDRVEATLIRIRELVTRLSHVEQQNVQNLLQQISATELQLVDYLQQADAELKPINRDYYYRGTDASELDQQLFEWIFSTGWPVTAEVWPVTDAMVRWAGTELREIRWRQATQLKLALIAYRISNGSYPERLDDLVGDGVLQEVPVDPPSKLPFAYYPHGVSLPLLKNDSAAEANVYQLVAPAGQPFLVVGPLFTQVESEVDVQTGEQGNRQIERKRGFVDSPAVRLFSNRMYEFDSGVLVLPQE